MAASSIAHVGRHIVDGREYGVNRNGEFYTRDVATNRVVLTGPEAFAEAHQLAESALTPFVDAVFLRKVMGYMDVDFWYVLADPRAQPPRRAHASDAGYDLAVCGVARRMRPEPGAPGWCGGSGWLARLAAGAARWFSRWLPGEVVLYDTGVAVQPPHGYYFELVPRSSIVKSGYMLANSVGVIDASYQGTIKVPLVKWCWWARDLPLPTRVAQLVLRKQYLASGVQLSEFKSHTARGQAGFGSTGAGAVACVPGSNSFGSRAKAE